MLHGKVKELQGALQREVEQHQRELTALQALHSERTQALSQSHERQVSQLQQRLEELEGGLAGRREGGRDFHLSLLLRFYR